MRSLLWSVVFAVFGHTLAAQPGLPYEVRTVGSFGVAAVNSVASLEETLAPSVVLAVDTTTTLDTRASLDPLQQLFALHWALARLTPQRNPDGAPGLRWIENGNASSSTAGFVGSTNDGGGLPVPVPAPHTVTLEVQAPTGSRGEIFAVWSGFTGGAIDLALDVGGNGVVDAAFSAPTAYAPGSWSTTIPVTAGPSGVRVDITQDVLFSTPGSGSYFSNLEVYYRPSGPTTPCIVTPGTNPCDLSLTGAIQLGATGATELDLDVTGLDPQSIGLLFVGVPAAQPITPTGAICPLVVEPVTTLFWFVSGPRRTWSFPVGNAPQLDFRVQAASYRFERGRGPVVQVSDALQIDCR